MRHILLSFLLCIGLFAKAQKNSTDLRKDLTSDDSTALLTIGSYPDSIRNRALLACQNPDILVKTEALQKNTSQSFRDLLSNYAKDEQQSIWNLTRQPGLISEITKGGKKSKEELETIASKYPSELRKSIVEVGKKHYDVLNEVNNLQLNSQKEFENILVDYPNSNPVAYRGLINHPDVLNTLSSNMHLAIILGNMYKASPQQTNHMLDSVNMEHTKQTVKDLEDWKKGLEENPEAKQEMEQAAKEYVKENQPNDKYSDDVYNTPSPPNQENTSSDDYTNPSVPANPPVVNNIYNVQPYPYWFGYPWWYDYPFWYPYPWWYNCGFYWGPAGIVYISFPSPFFMHWYFFHPYHHYYYSHFTDFALGYHNQHYYGPRYQHTGFNNEIHRWAGANEPNLPKGYFHADPQRPQRIKELGKFEMDYHNTTKGVFGRNITRPEFLQSNPNYYPHLNPVINQPHFNRPITYPQQQSTPHFNTNFNRPQNNVPRGNSFPQPHFNGGGGGIKRGR